MRNSRILTASGVTLGTAVGVIGLFIPGGGLGWFLHTATGQLGVPLGVALIAAGAVARRLERSEEETRALRGDVQPPE
jgi:hypothetical protein